MGLSDLRQGRCITVRTQGLGLSAERAQQARTWDPLRPVSIQVSGCIIQCNAHREGVGDPAGTRETKGSIEGLSSACCRALPEGMSKLWSTVTAKTLTVESSTTRAQEHSGPPQVQDCVGVRQSLSGGLDELCGV